MEPLPSPDPVLLTEEVDRLFDDALEAIVGGLDGRPPTLRPLSTLPAGLRSSIGSFVSLYVDDELNGCIGTVERVEPLGRAVPRLAWSAAFGDPRLPALRSSEIDRLTIEISLLSALAPIGADSFETLIELVLPRCDGVVVRAGGRQGLFLPSVWGQLPDPDAFVAQLFHKAGLTPGSWPVGTQAHRFTTTTYRRGPSRRPADPAGIRASR